MVKRNISDLAVFGGSPAFREPLHVGRPNIGDKKRLFERLETLLERRWLTNEGPFALEFEQRLASLIGVKHCIAMCNGTVALEIAIRALGLSGEVILPSFTFVATAHALQWQEITPVFCDIDPNTYTIDPARVEQLITPRTSGLIGTHIWGHPCDVAALTEICSRHDLKLLFDAAHAFWCSHNGQMVGTFGETEIFSFHATKFVNSFEGGAVATNDDDLAAKIRLMKNFGFDGYDNVIYIGTNGKMHEASAAMGLTSLDSLEQFLAAYQRNYERYLAELAGLDGLELLRYNDSERTNYQYIVLNIDESKTRLSRDSLVRVLHGENILARRYFYPGCHRMEPYRSYFPNAGLLLPETEKVVDRVLSLPTGQAIDPDQIAVICSLIRFALDNSQEINDRLILMDKSG